MNTDKGKTMTKISAIGKYLDQPLLISKLNKHVPYILSGFAGGYLIKEVHKIPKEEIPNLIKQLSSEMQLAAANLEFEKAAAIRDEIERIKKETK